METFWITTLLGAGLTIGGVAISVWSAIDSHNKSIKDKARADSIAQAHQSLLTQNYNASLSIIDSLNESSLRVNNLLNNSITTLENQNKANKELQKQTIENVRTQQLITQSGHNLVDTVNRATQDLTDNLIGGDSYLMFTVSDVNESLDTGIWAVFLQGKHPLKNISVEILDLNMPEANSRSLRSGAGERLDLGELYPNHALHPNLPPLRLDKHLGVRINIFTAASNGFTTQEIRMRFVNNHWVNATRIGPSTWEVDKPVRYMIEYIDPNYPIKDKVKIFE